MIAKIHVKKISLISSFMRSLHFWNNEALRAIVIPLSLKDTVAANNSGTTKAIIIGQTGNN